MKKILVFALAALLLITSCLSFASCGTDDWKKIEEQGYFTCGITYYDPMNYFNEDGDLVGFDTEFAQAVAKELGVEVKFQIISWSAKYTELDSGSIDAIWNGFTRGNESDGTSRADYVDFSYDYLNNSQCIVMKADAVASYSSLESLAGLRGMAEGGSAGEAVAQSASENYTAAASQVDALMNLEAGTVDFVVVDILMANSLVGTASYADLAKNTAIELEAEVYAIGFRKGSTFTERVNAAIKTLSENGTLAAIAEKYGLSNALITGIGQ